MMGVVYNQKSSTNYLSASQCHGLFSHNQQFKSSQRPNNPKIRGKKKHPKTKKNNKKKFTVSEKSWSEASFREKIICSILCCCFFEDG